MEAHATQRGAGGCHCAKNNSDSRVGCFSITSLGQAANEPCEASTLNEKAVSNYCGPLLHKPPPLNGDCNRDPCIKALERRVFINHGSTSSLAPVADAV